MNHYTVIGIIGILSGILCAQDGIFAKMIRTQTEGQAWTIA